MLRNKDRQLKRERKLVPKCRKDTHIKKNIRHKQPIEFQVKGTAPLKFCREIPLTTEVKRLLGRCVYKILPGIAKQPGYVPHLVIYRDTQTNVLVIKAQLVEREDFLCFDKAGKPIFVPDTEFSLT